MKNLFKKIIIGCLISMPIISNAQFATNPPFFNYGFTDFPATMQKIGIGNFPNNASVQAKLHVNRFLLATDAPTDGLMFRTDGINNTDNIWSIYTGANNNALSEKFRLYVAANSNNAVLQTQQANIRMLFNTNGAINRMLIMDGGTGSTDGRIAMGNDLLPGFTPLSRLHLHQTAAVNTIRFTTDNMVGGNGFEVGYDATSNIQNRQYAVLNNRENTAMKFWTNNTQRMHINQSRQSQVATGIGGTNIYNIFTPGYVGIGRNNPGNNWGTNASNGQGPITLLHLNNDAGSPELRGYRPWMRGGITFTENVDLAYVGMRPFFQNTAGPYDDNNIIPNRNEFTITWANNPGPGLGPDDLCFRFTTTTTPATYQQIDINDLNSAADYDGRHIARFTALGFMGLGPTFGQENPIYVIPASLQHLSWNNMQSVYSQYTNRDLALGSGTGEDIADGLRVGIHGNTNNQMNGNAIVYNQERKHLLFSTDANTNSININNAQTLERVRITSYRTPTNLPNGTYGLWNPANLGNSNATRMSISYNPAQPVTRPMSLLHLGFNTDANNNHNGWRPWMDVGMFANRETDNVFIGLKNEPSIGGNRYDAVLNWGDDDATNPNTGPDNLRFIFTAATGTNIAPANSTDGLEVARMSPDIASTLTNNYGMMGIGNFSPGSGQGFGTPAYIDAKLDIDGDLRIRTVTEDSSDLVLVIDTNDYNRVHWRKISTLPGGGFGTCNSPTTFNGNSGAANLNNTDNFHFLGNNSGSLTVDNVMIGATTCITPSAKLHVMQSSTALSSTGLLVENTDEGHATDWCQPAVGIKSVVNSNATFNRRIAGWFEATPVNAADKTLAIFVPQAGGEVSIGYDCNNIQPVGHLLQVNSNIWANGMSVPSDQSYKTNITNIPNALNKVLGLNGVNFYFDTTGYPQYNFSSDYQVGLIAQNVDTVLPELVTHLNTGFLGLDYPKLTAVLVEAIKELNTNNVGMQTTIDSLNTSLNSLTQQVQQMQNCFNQLCGNNNINNNGGSNNTNTDELGNTINVELSNGHAIVLEQNIPNPFNENTSINYYIPENITYAQIIFTDMHGRVIKTVDIKQSGNGQLKVYAANLSQGIYQYSILVDGKVIDTKKMVVEK